MCTVGNRRNVGNPLLFCESHLRSKQYDRTIPAKTSCLFSFCSRRPQQWGWKWLFCVVSFVVKTKLMVAILWCDTFNEQRPSNHISAAKQQQQRRREEPRQLDSSSGHRSGRPRAGSAGPPGGSRGGRRGTRPGHAAQGPRPLAGTFPSRGLRGVPAVRGDTGSRPQPRPRVSLAREESRRDASAGVLPLRPPNWRRAFRAAGPASASD